MALRVEIPNSLTDIELADFIERQPADAQYAKYARKRIYEAAGRPLRCTAGYRVLSCADREQFPASDVGSGADWAVRIRQQVLRRVRDKLIS